MEPEPDIYDNIEGGLDTLEELIQKVQDIEVNEKVPIKSMAVQNTRIPLSNILDPANREGFVRELEVETSEIVSPPITTTITLNGMLSNLTFVESVLINQLDVNEEVLLIKCNHGTKKHPNFVEKIKIRKNKRGRYPIPRPKLKRKYQGDGSCFSSQISFFLRRLVDTDDEKQYFKFKVFRTGVIQLPGAKPHLLDEILNRTDVLIKLFNDCLRPETPIRIMNLNPFMKNYKFIIRMPLELTDNKEDERINFKELFNGISLGNKKMYQENIKILPPGSFVDLQVLKKLLILVRMKYSGVVINDALLEKIQAIDDPYNCMRKVRGLEIFKEQELPFGDIPKIFDIKYTKEESKLCVKFDTPLDGRPKKRTRINVFTRGKVNILGAFDEVVTTKIYNFISRLFRYFEKNLVPTDIPESINEYVLVKDLDNVSSPSINDEHAKHIINIMMNGGEELPKMEFDDNNIETLAKLLPNL